MIIDECGAPIVWWVVSYIGSDGKRWGEACATRNEAIAVAAEMRRHGERNIRISQMEG